jgi:hypothetical protein
METCTSVTNGISDGMTRMDKAESVFAMAGDSLNF